jgi:hypothetical protein
MSGFEMAMPVVGLPLGHALGTLVGGAADYVAIGVLALLGGWMYDAMLEEIPRARMRLHVCLGAPDGIVLVDTCPTKEIFESFARGDDFRALRERHGFPEPSKLEDFPVHRAFIAGREIHL